jgi:hypothetical protein
MGGGGGKGSGEKKGIEKPIKQLETWSVTSWRLEPIVDYDGFIQLNMKKGHGW